MGCENCGSEIRENEAYCTTCGRKVNMLMTEGGAATNISGEENKSESKKSGGWHIRTWRCWIYSLSGLILAVALCAMGYYFSAIVSLIAGVMANPKFLKKVTDKFVVQLGMVVLSIFMMYFAASLLY